MKRTLTVTGFALLLAVLVLLAGSNWGRSHDQGRERPLDDVARPGAVARNIGPKSSRDAGPRGSAPSVTREAASGEDVEESPAGEGEARQLLVDVVRANSAAPVPDADVGFLDNAKFNRELKAAGVHHFSAAGKRLRAKSMGHVVTNQAGRAEIPWEDTPLVVEARRDGLWGFGFVMRFQKTPLRIELEEDEELRVRVVGAGPARETGVGGVPVSLRRREEVANREHYQSRDRYSRAPDGLVVFEHVQRRLRSSEKVWFLTFGFPHVPERRIEVRRPLPHTPIVMLVPATGALRLLLRDPEGAVIRRPGMHLRLTAAPSAHPDEVIWTPSSWGWLPVGEDGVVDVPFLGLGLELRAELRIAGERFADQRFAGPKQAGELVEVTYLVEEKLPCRLIGRFVDGDRAAIRPRFMSVFACRGAERQRLSGVAIGPDGSTFAVDYPQPHAAFEELRFQCRVDGDTRQASVPLPDELREPEHDLGDVVLEQGELLAAGRVQDESGSPLSQAMVQVQRELESGQWRGLGGAAYDTTDTNGRFRCYAPNGIGDVPMRLRLTVRDRDQNRAEFVVRKGSEGVVVTVARGARIVGQVRFLEGQDSRDIALSLFGGGLGRGGSSPDPQGRFEFSGLDPDRYVLQVRIRNAGGAQSVRQVKNIVVRAGQTNRDARLQGLTVGEGALVYSVRVVEARTGDPVAQAVLDWPGSGEDPAKTDHTGRARLYFDAVPVSLRIRAAGYRTATLQALEPEMRVELQAGIPLEVVLADNPPELPDTARICLLLYSERNGKREIAVPNQGFVYFDEEAKASCILPGPGQYLLESHVLINDARSARSARIASDPERLQVRNEERVRHRLRLEAAAIRAALTEAQAR